MHQPYFVRHNTSSRTFGRGKRSRVHCTGKPREPKAGDAGKKMLGKMAQESLGRACTVGAATGIAGAVWVWLESRLDYMFFVLCSDVQVQVLQLVQVAEKCNAAVSPHHRPQQQS